MLDIKIKIFIQESPIEIERGLIKLFLELNEKLQRVSLKFDGVLHDPSALHLILITNLLPITL